MRFSLIALLILAFAAVAHSQVDAVSSEPNPNLEIVKAKWQIGLGGYNGIGMGFSNPADRAGIANSGHTGHVPLDFAAKLLVKNTSAKTMTGFDLDYLFLDAAGSEFLRYRFHAKVDIKPGQEKQLKQKVHQDTGNYRKSYTPLKPDNERLLKSRFSVTRLIVRRIEYADGSVWERP